MSLTLTVESDLPTVFWRHYLFQKTLPNSLRGHTLTTLSYLWVGLGTYHCIMMPCAYFSCHIFTLFYNVLLKYLSLPQTRSSLGKMLLFISLFLALCVWQIVVGAHQMPNEWRNATSFTGYHLQRKWQHRHPEPSFWSETRSDFRT